MENLVSYLKLLERQNDDFKFRSSLIKQGNEENDFQPTTINRIEISVDKGVLKIVDVETSNYDTVYIYPQQIKHLLQVIKMIDTDI